MNKKVLLILVAALLLTSAVACNKDNGDDKETTGSTTTTNPANTGDYIIVPGTDSDGNPVTYLEPVVTTEPETDISEPNPTFADVSKQVVVVAKAATLRTSTVIANNNGCAWPQENRVLNVTGESGNWYRVDYDGTPCYIAKTVVADYDVIQAFTPLNDEVEISEASVNIRSYPSTATSLSIRGQLTKGTKVTRVAIGDGWSRILFEVKSETETDESGNAKVEIMQYYVSNDCITSLSEETSADAETTVADTTAAETTAAEN